MPWVGSLFDKTYDKFYVFSRKEEDWWPNMNKDLAAKQWCLGKRTFYYYTQFSCLIACSPSLKKEKITILCESDKVPDATEWIKEFQQ